MKSLKSDEGGSQHNFKNNTTNADDSQMPLQTSTKKTKSKKVKEELKPQVSQFQEGFMKELENMSGIKD